MASQRTVSAAQLRRVRVLTASNTTNLQAISAMGRSDIFLSWRQKKVSGVLVLAATLPSASIHGGRKRLLRVFSTVTSLSE
jgi:hypothetical protein